MSLRSKTVMAVAIVGASVGVGGCSLQVPRDPEGTLQRVTGTTLRVGVSPAEGLVDVSGQSPHGPGARLGERFARTLDAEVDWTVAGEEDLVLMLEEGDLDVALGGFTSATPWVDKVGITRPYEHLAGVARTEVVFLVPAGENALLAKLEAFLDSQVIP